MSNLHLLIKYPIHFLKCIPPKCLFRCDQKYCLNFMLEGGVTIDNQKYFKCPFSKAYCILSFSIYLTL